MPKQSRPAPKPQWRRVFFREWRDFRGLTQDQLADRIGKSRGLIAQLETHRTRYTADTLEAMADALQCEPWDLLNVDPSKAREVVDISDLLRHATPEQKAEVVGFVRGLVRRQ